MKRIIILTLACGIFGCSPKGTGPAVAPQRPGDSLSTATQPTTRSSLDDEIVAVVGPRKITARQMLDPLIEAHGLSLLINVAQLEVVKEHALRAGLSIVPADIDRERELTLSMLFRNVEKEDYPSAMKQFLEQQGIAEPEFRIIVERNAYLRKLAEPIVGKDITDAQLQEAFNVLYGEKVKVRHIQLANMQEVAEVKKRLAAGEKFEDVAKALSRNSRTAGLGGELQAFNRNTAGLPATFKDAAFALQVGEVSDAIMVENAFQVIRLDQRIAPKVIKYEEVKESVRETLLEQATQAAVQKMLGEVAEQVRTNLKIYDPAIKRQFDAKLNERSTELRNREEYRRELERDRLRRAEEQAATQPATDASATEPAATEAGVPESPAPVAPAPVAPAPVAPAPVAPSPATAPAATAPATQP